MERGRPEISEQITFFYAAEYDRVRNFYREVLGFEQVLDQGGCCIYRVRADTFLGVCRREEGEGQTGQGEVIYTLVTADVDGWHAHLRRCGVEVEGEPVQNDSYRIYHFFFRDPAGNRFEVQRFWDEDWFEGDE